MSNRLRHAAAGLLALLAVLAIYALRLNGIAGNMVDDAWYLLLAKSLADGGGYRLLSSPLEAILPLYPPGFPAVLSMVFRVNPEFPGNLPLLKSVSIAAMMGVGALTYTYLRTRQLDRALALSTALTTVLVPAFVFLATSTVMSECVFALLQLAAVVLIHRSEGSRHRLQGLALIVAAAAIATGALFIRSAAAALVAAATVWLLKERQWQRAAVFAGIVTMLYAPWLFYTRAHGATAEQRAAHGGAVAYSYFDQLSMRWAGTPAMGRVTLGDIPARVATNVTDITVRGMGGIFLPVIFRGPIESGEEVIGLGGVVGLLPGSMGVARETMAISAGFAGVVMVGFVAVVRRRVTVTELLVPTSIAIVLLWPFWSFRFLLPLTPFLFFYLVMGLNILTRSTRAARLTLLCILGLAIYDHAGYIAHARSTGARSEWVGSMDALDATLRWVTGSLPQDGLVASTNPALLYLRTGRTSIAYDDPSLSWRGWRAKGVRYVVCLMPLELPASNPGDYHTVYHSPGRMWVVDLQAP